VTQKRKPTNGKAGKKRAKGTSPINGTAPPAEYRFAPGNRAAVGHGRPRKLKELQDLIKDVMAQELNVSGERLTRIEAAIRLGLSKNPTVWLEYAFGKMPQTNIDKVELSAVVEAYDYGNAIAPLAPRPVGDSLPSGEGESSGDGATVGKDDDGG